MAAPIMMHCFFICHAVLSFLLWNTFIVANREAGTKLQTVIGFVTAVINEHKIIQIDIDRLQTVIYYIYHNK